jgi:homoserine kinase
VIVVRVPASTANLGPAFDGLGMALTLHAEVGAVGDDEEVDGPALPERARFVEETHPADVGFRRAGGRGRLWVRSPIPMGRGLGYSGAMRVGGLMAAVAQGHEPVELVERLPVVLALAAELEGHADNAAASLLGGVVAVAGGRAVRVPLAVEPAVLVWVPRTTTSTERSRAMLSASVPFRDAVFNVTRTALLVAALAAGDVAALARATEDRLHQDVRFATVPQSRAALAAGLEAGAWCGWLSGSGPSIALLSADADADAVAGALPADGVAKRLAIDLDGATVIATA